MEIGNVIRKYRKEKEMTQEEMAKRLGVSAPAVNKWENGNAFPDITLLVPIARLLEINVDTLLSFRENLGNEEINNLVEEVNSRLKTEDYATVFQWVKQKIEEYPNCECLILWMTQVLDAYRTMYDVPNSQVYDEPIRDYYIRALESDEEDIRNTAADALFYYYFKSKEYEKSEQYLSYFSKENPERKRKQAMIYSRTNRKEEAYKAYEELLFVGYQSLSMTFQNMFALAMEDEDLKKAHLLAKKQEQLVYLFEMGEYQAVSGKLELAIVEKDVEATLQIVEKMFANVGNMAAFRESALYEHMTFREVSEEFQKEIRENLIEMLQDNGTFSYMIENERWKSLIESLHCEK